MTAAKKLDLPPMSFDDYVDHERHSPVKHEIWDGRLVAMAGAVEEHNDVARNLLSELDRDFKDGGCKPYGSDQMVYCPGSDKGAYPDVSAVCGPREFREEKDPEEKRVLLNPTLVVEVLSRSTAKRDFASKFDRYASIPSLQEYVLIDPTTAWARSHVRTDAGWRLKSFNDLSEDLVLESLDARIPMAKVYFGVEVGPVSRVIEDPEPDADEAATDDGD